MFKDSYKRRHVVLNGEQSLGALVYYKDAKDTRPKGSIDLLDAEIREEGPGPVCVSIRVSSVSLLVFCWCAIPTRKTMLLLTHVMSYRACFRFNFAASL